MNVSRYKEALSIVVDWLPDDEAEVVTALFWEQTSLRTVAERLGWRLPGGDLDAKKVERTRDVAFARIAALVEALDELGFQVMKLDEDEEGDVA